MSLLMRQQWAELRAARGRWAALLTALALSVAAVVALAQAGERLSRALRENYLATTPAHASLLLPAGFDPVRAQALVAEVAQQEDIAAARLTASASARLRAVGSERWRSALLFALPAPGEPALSHGLSPQGPAPRGAEMWVERDAATLLAGAREIELAGGARLTVTGQQHDPALAPASTEGVIYGYLPYATLSTLPGVHAQAALLLRFKRVEVERDQARADALARRTAAWLDQQGLPVQLLRVPPLAEHPHQRQAEGAVQMLLACAVLATVLCAVTATTLLRGWLDGQRRSLGVLQVLGASREALAASCLALVALLCSLAAGLGAVLGLGAGEALARVSAQLLNLSLLPWQASAVALGTGLGLGLLLPLAFTAIAVWRWAGQAPATALAEQTLQRPDALSRLPVPGPLALRLAVRNALRRRSRFVMSCLLLATAGAVFMGGLNLRAAWAQLVEAGAAQRHFQVELSVATPLNPLAMASLVRDTPDVLVTEPWPSQRANWAGSLSRTYPDGGHGQLLLRRVPPQAQLQQPRLLQGRWLAEAVQPDDLVLNTAALSTLEKAANLGDPVALELDGEILRGRLVGVVEEPLSPPTVYAPGSAEGTSRQWRLALRPSADPEATVARLAQQLPAMRATLEADQRRAGSNHLLVLQRALAWVAIGTGVVGLVALASALGSGVAERRRELGVLRSLGASDRLLGAAVVLEAGLVVTLSLGLAVLLGMAIDPLLAARLAAITGQPLETHASAWSVRLWAALAAAGGVLASTLPARAAVQRA